MYTALVTFLSGENWVTVDIYSSTAPTGVVIYRNFPIPQNLKASWLCSDMLVCTPGMLYYDHPVEELKKDSLLIVTDPQKYIEWIL